MKNETCLMVLVEKHETNKISLREMSAKLCNRRNTFSNYLSLPLIVEFMHDVHMQVRSSYVTVFTLKFDRTVKGLISPSCSARAKSWICSVFKRNYARRPIVKGKSIKKHTNIFEFYR